MDQPPPVRPTFDREVFDRSIQFADDLLRLVPELEGLAIIPSFTIPQDRLPVGVVRGRHKRQNPAELMRMHHQLYAVLKSQIDELFKVLRDMDGVAGDLAARITKLREEDDFLTKEIDGKFNILRSDSRPDAQLGPGGDGTSPNAS